MSALTFTETNDDPHVLRALDGGGHHGSAGHGWSGPAPKRIVTGYGFWIFILSDMIMFSAFFATYAVLLGQTAGGPGGHDLFNLRNVAIETGFLLASSFTCGMASIAADFRNKVWFQSAMAVTCAFGLAFLTIEGREFADLVARGAGPTRSAFLSAFFTLVGCHGLHVSGGILWLLTMMAQVFAKGFRPDIQRRILCFALFWHALDIIWIAVFTVVYLLGSAK
jgi:cytochrome o ubiquinol oxidase subunit 3